MGNKKPACLYVHGTASALSLAMKASFIWFFISALTAFKAPAADPKTDHRGEVMPLISMDNVQLHDAVEALARQDGINYIFDPAVLAPFEGSIRPRVPEPCITAKWTNVTASQVLDGLIQTYNLKVTTNPVTTVERFSLASQIIQPVPPSQLGLDTNQPIPLIRMDDVPLRDAIKNLAREAKLSVAFHLPTAPDDDDSPLKSVINLRWKNLTAKQALVALLDNYDLLMVQYPDTATVHIIAKRQPAH